MMIRSSALVILTLLALDVTAQSTGGAGTGVYTGAGTGVAASTAGSGGSGSLESLLDTTRTTLYEVAGSLGGVLFVAFLVCIYCCVKRRAAIAAMLPANSWAQNLLDSKTTPLGAGNAAQVMSAMQSAESAIGMSAATQTALNTLVTTGTTAATTAVNGTAAVTTALTTIAPINNTMTALSQAVPPSPGNIV